MNKVPNLRFKEFRGEWEVKRLGEIVKFTNGKAHENCIDEHGEYIVVNSKFISSNGKVIKKSRENLCSLKMSDIVLVMSDVPNGKALAKCYFIEQDSKYTLNQRICALTPIFIESKFLFYILNRNKYFLKFDNGVGQTNLRKDEILNCPLIIPSLEEQKKIASFFSLIDKKIELQTEKVEELKNYKKVIMQKIFSQELRFKDENGNEYPEWEEKKLENIVEFFKGNGLSKSDLSDNGDIPCVLYGELFTQYDEVINIVKSKCLKDQGFKSEKYDVLMPTSDVTPEGLATASCILVDDVCLGGDINVLRPKKYINGIFLSYQINHFKSLIIRKVSGTTIKHIYVKDIKDIKYNIPCEKEQIKITDLLIQIDNKIKFESLKLESYNKLKKGLLQQMFI